MVDVKPVIICFECRSEVRAVIKQQSVALVVVSHPLELNSADFIALKVLLASAHNPLRLDVSPPEEFKDKREKDPRVFIYFSECEPVSFVLITFIPDE